MTGEPVPACETCAHNLHRVGDGRHPRPEPTDLCRNELGMFHMLDCPLTLGLSCTYYAQAAAPHPTTSDLELEAAREELSAGFLGWRYRRRVRFLTKPRTVVPVGLRIEGAIEPEESVPEALAMRTPAPVPVEPAAPAGATAEAADGQAAAATPAAPAAPERYPGQRRSEERLAKKRARLAALDAAKAAKAAQIAAAAQSPPASESAEGDDFDDEEEGGDEFGGDLVDVEPADTGPKTVEQILAALPDAPIVTERSQGGGRPRGDGAPRHRRRRGRRGGGGPRQGGGPGSGGAGAGGRGRGPRPHGPRGGGPPRPSGPPA